MRKLLAILMALVMLLGLFTLGASADPVLQADEADDVHFTLNKSENAYDAGDKIEVTAFAKGHEQETGFEFAWTCNVYPNPAPAAQAEEAIPQIELVPVDEAAPVNDAAPQAEVVPQQVLLGTISGVNGHIFTVEDSVSGWYTFIAETVIDDEIYRGALNLRVGSGTAPVIPDPGNPNPGEDGDTIIIDNIKWKYMGEIVIRRDFSKTKDDIAVAFKDLVGKVRFEAPDAKSFTIDPDTGVVTIVKRFLRVLSQTPPVLLMYDVATGQPVAACTVRITYQWYFWPLAWLAFGFWYV